MRGSIDRIDDGVWVGPAPLTPGDYQGLAQLGIQEVLCLQTESESMALGVDPVDAVRMARNAGLGFQRVAIRDYDVRSMAAEVPSAVRKLLYLLQQDRVVYVHCAAGINRAPTVVAGALALRHSLTGEQACSWVVALHPSAPDRHVVGSIAGR